MRRFRRGGEGKVATYQATAHLLMRHFRREGGRGKCCPTTRCRPFADAAFSSGEGGAGEGVDLPHICAAVLFLIWRSRWGGGGKWKWTITHILPSFY